MLEYEMDYQKVGAYLAKLIEKKYPSHRQFCKAYLEQTEIDPNSEELRKMSNRLSQILKGKKAIQTYDLPIFTELLDVSCEEILSCGKTFVPISGHITNYQVAFSKKPNVWKSYVEHPDKLILNPDEYNKTVIDYAIEFKNYKFLKFLMDEGYIWFVDDSKHDCIDRIFGFAAGTSIARRKVGYIDSALGIELEYKSEECGLRQKVIALAMENKDFDILDSLRAREVPALYQLCVNGANARTNCRSYYVDDVAEAIALSNDKVLAYFSDEFQITDQHGETHSFIYPFLDKVIEKLLKNKSKYAEPIIRKAIEHNQKVYDSLQSMVDDAAKYILDNSPEWMNLSHEELTKQVMWYYKFIPEDGFAAYLFSKEKKNYVKFNANLIRVDIVHSDLLLESLIKQLNELFDAVQNIQPKISIQGEK